MTRQLLLVASLITLVPVCYLSWQSPIAVTIVAQEDDCPLHSATGFRLDAVVRLDATRVACQYGKGWAL